MYKINQSSERVVRVPGDIVICDREEEGHVARVAERQTHWI